MNEIPRPCPDCGTPLPADSPQALCPACLLRQALASRTRDDAGNAASVPPAWSPEEIADQFPGYEILECLGRGGMGVVYKARQKSLDRLVAIKILPPERVGEERFSERFAIEAATLAKLSHPNIVTVHDFGETGGLFYIVMEYVDGVNLRDLLREGKLEPKQALAIVPPVCDALQFAHDKGIVHRDIKPENLLLDRDGRIKIADFGIASLVGAGGESAGTPPYMAPEQKGTHIDHRADIYALGVVLYEMLTGERPGKEIVAPSRKVLLDVRIDEMVLRALEKEPERRYQTAGEFRTMVETIGSTPAMAKPPAIPASAPPRGMIRRWWWLFLVMIPLGMAFGLAAGAVLTYIIPKKYEARAIIEVRPPAAARTTPQFFATEFEKLTSPGVLMQVSDRLELANRWMQQRDRVIAVLKGLVDVDHIRGTDLIVIRVRHTNPEETAEIANMLAGVYRETSPNERIVHEAATVPRKPSSPNPAFCMIIGALAGVMVSPVLALLAMVILQRLAPDRRHQPVGGVRQVGATIGSEMTGAPGTGGGGTRASGSGRMLLLGTGLHGLCLLEIVLALALLVPAYRDLLAAFDVQLPLAAELVLSLSRFVLNGGWLMFPPLLAVDLLVCWLLLKSASRTPFAVWVVTGLLGMFAAAIMGAAVLSNSLARLAAQMGDGDSAGISLAEFVTRTNLAVIGSWRNILPMAIPLVLGAALVLALAWGQRHQRRKEMGAGSAGSPGSIFGWAIALHGMVLLVIALATLFLHPYHAATLADSATTLPVATQWMFALGRFVWSGGWLAFPAVFALDILVCRLLFKLPSRAPFAAWVLVTMTGGILIAAVCFAAIFFPISPLDSKPANANLQGGTGGFGPVVESVGNGATDYPKGSGIQAETAHGASAQAPPEATDRILVEDLALHLIVAIREKDDAKLKSLASDRIKGWPEALPVFAVELREHMRQITGNDKFDLRAGESLVDGDFAAVRCVGPAELHDKCLVLFFVKTADGWRNHSLRNSSTATPLAPFPADLKKKAADKK